MIFNPFMTYENIISIYFKSTIFILYRYFPFRYIYSWRLDFKIFMITLRVLQSHNKKYVTKIKYSFWFMG